MKTIKFFLVYSFFFLLNPTLAYAAPTGQKSFIASLPIVPLIILFLLLIVSGAIVYLQLKKEKQTPYGLPVSRPPEPPTETPPLTQSVNPPVQGYPEPTQPDLNTSLPTSLTPPISPTPPPVSEPPLPTIVPPTSPAVKPVFPKAVIISLIFIFTAVSVIGGVFFLRKKVLKPKIFTVDSSKQCTSGCHRDVCVDADSTGYNWCSNDARCKCAGAKNAVKLDPQEWCDDLPGTVNTKWKCGVTAGGCGKIAIGTCGGPTIAGCQTYRDCVNQGIECGWPASTYCYRGQCTCADIGQQREMKIEHPDWRLCEDTAPGCTPPACPSGWIDCGLGHARTDNSPTCVAKEKCGPISCQGCGNKYVVWRFCKQGGGTTPQVTPTPTSTPTSTPTPTPTPTFACNNLTIDKQTAVVGDTVNLTASITNFGLLHYGRCPGATNCRAVDTPNHQTLAQGNNTFTANVRLTEAGIYVFELNAYESDQCRFLCSPGRILYQNTLHVGPGTPTPTFPVGTPTPVFPGCDSAGHWQQIATQCNSGTNCIKWLIVGGLTPTVTPTVTPPPVCRGLRLLLNRGGSTWSDMTASERNTVQPGTVVRVALPKVVGSFTAEKAEFHVYIDGATELQRDSTDEMDIGGIRYFYTEFTARYGASPPTTFSSYSIDGWLYFNGTWY